MQPTEDRTQERRARLQNLCAMAQERIDRIAPALPVVRELYLAADDGEQADALLTATVTMEAALYQERVQLAEHQRMLDILAASADAEAA